MFEPPLVDRPRRRQLAHGVHALERMAHGALHRKTFAAECHLGVGVRRRIPQRIGVVGGTAPLPELLDPVAGDRVGVEVLPDRERLPHAFAHELAPGRGGERQGQQQRGGGAVDVQPLAQDGHDGVQADERRTAHGHREKQCHRHASARRPAAAVGGHGRRIPGPHQRHRQHGDQRPGTHGHQFVPLLTGEPAHRIDENTGCQPGDRCRGDRAKDERGQESGIETPRPHIVCLQPSARGQLPGQDPVDPEEAHPRGTRVEQEQLQPPGSVSRGP